MKPDAARADLSSRIDQAVPPRGSSREVRGTQSFVYTLSWCWRHPGLTGIEVAWRWLVGIPAAFIVCREATRIWNSVPVDVGALRQMTILNPMAAAETIGKAAGLLLPPALNLAQWLAPALVVAWIVASSFGRTVLLHRIGRLTQTPMHARPVTLMLLQSVRVLALGAVFAAWLWCLHAASQLTVTGPIARGNEPNLVLLCALAIVATFGIFTLWATVSWVFSLAPLLAMQRKLGPLAALKAAFRVRELKSKLVEINLVMGIVKIALVVLAMVFSACPLPFESIATPEFMTHWYMAVGVWYLVASDFFHVIRLAAYVQLWRVYERAC